jgi:hypothetical protein
LCDMVCVNMECFRHVIVLSNTFVTGSLLQAKKNDD